MLPRTLEPEVMESAEEAVDYDQMDHSTVNQLFVNDLLTVLRSESTEEHDRPGLQVVDVRTAAEIQKAPLTGCNHAIHIPVDELRERLHELDASRPTVVSCGVGVRGHVAQRILQQKGFQQVFNLSGGATLRRRAVPE